MPLRLFALAALLAVATGCPGRTNVLQTTQHLTLNPVIDAAPGGALARSVLLIVDPGPPPALATAAQITQELRREGGAWKISRRTVSAPGPAPELPGHHLGQA